MFCGGFVVVLVYVLSSGPLLGLERRKLRGAYIELGVEKESLTREILAPLNCAYHQPLFHKALGLYWHLWWPEMFDKNGNCI